MLYAIKLMIIDFSSLALVNVNMLDKLFRQKRNRTKILLDFPKLGIICALNLIKGFITFKALSNCNVTNSLSV